MCDLSYQAYFFTMWEVIAAVNKKDPVRTTVLLKQKIYRTIHKKAKP